LSQDVDAINKELASSAMSLNSKMNYWLFIQADLKIILKTKVEALNRLYLPLVKNINGKDPWSVFQEVLIKQTKIS
jgi:hypothetical protein